MDFDLEWQQSKVEKYSVVVVLKAENVFVSKYAITSCAIEKTRRTGRKLTSNDWSVWQMNSTCSQLGMMVSKKHFPRAVDRNRIKRSLRSIFQDLLTSQGSCKMVIRAHRSTCLRRESYRGLREMLGL